MRVAVYFTPPSDHALVRAAAEWLGRDAFSGDCLRRPPVRGLDPDEIETITAEPRRYGFHATLKAPFRLADGMGFAEVAAAARAFAAGQVAFPAPHLSVQVLGEFIALTPEGECPALRRLADQVVRAFEPYRAPLEDTEIERRLRAGLNQAQRRHLENWGYPYVFEEFCFHMTLTGALESGMRSRALAVLRKRFRTPLQESLSIDAVTLFVEPGPGREFRVRARYPFAAIEGRA